MPNTTTIIISTIHYATKDHQSSSVSIWHIVAVVCLTIICIILSIAIYLVCRILRERTENRYIFRGIFDRSAKKRLRLLNAPSLPVDDDPQCFKCPACQAVNEGLRSKWRAKNLERNRMMEIRDHVMLQRHRSLSRISRFPSFRTRHVFTLGGGCPKSSSRTTSASNVNAKCSIASVNAKRSTASVNADVTLTDLTVDLSLFVDTILADTANTFLVTANTLKTETSTSEVTAGDSTSILNVELCEKSSMVEKLDLNMNNFKKEEEPTIETELRVLNWGELDDENLIGNLNIIVGGPKNSSTPNNSVEISHF